MDRLSERTFGQYDLQEVIGSGGMGTVYRGIHRKLRQARAVKVLPPQLAMDGSFVERFEREATISAELKHPNIVLIHDFSEEDGFHYIAMELVDGVSLRELIRREGYLPIDRSIGILGQLADALDYAHGRGVIHRDLKSANVLVGENDHVTLLDFGLARAFEASDLTKSGAIVGTPEYLAPEVVSGGGRAGGPSVDLYALGVIAYEMLTGRVPFTGMDSARLMFAHAYDRPPSPRTFRPDLPEPVEVALLRQLAKNPQERFRTAGAFVVALRGAHAYMARLATATGGPTTAPLRRLGVERVGDSAGGHAGARTAADLPRLSTPAAGIRRRHAIAVGKWVAVAGRMLIPRYLHTATLLPDGRVLVAGGSNGEETTAITEVYDPAEDKWATVGRMSTGRARAAALLLSTGKVLIIGGANNGKAVASADLFDPATGAWHGVRHMANARHLHTATQLPDGRILVIGGVKSGMLRSAQTDSAEIYEPETDRWENAGRMEVGRSDHAATLLPSGEVLITGGYNGSRILASVEVFEPAVGAWSSAPSLNIARARHTATLLPDGRVLVAGGAGENGVALATAELFDPPTRTWALQPPMSMDREGHTGTLLRNGSVLLAGGHDSRGAAMTSTETYDPFSATFAHSAWLAMPRRWHTATMLADGEILAIGGLDSTNSPLATAELF
jgi:hypothetical protein